MINLDEYEKDILQLVELQSCIKNQKKKAISIRVNEHIYKLKKKALKNSIPYQNIIQILIHQFATNKIQLSM